MLLTRQLATAKCKLPKTFFFPKCLNQVTKWNLWGTRTSRAVSSVDFPIPHWLQFSEWATTTKANSLKQTKPQDSPTQLNMKTCYRQNASSFENPHPVDCKTQCDTSWSNKTVRITAVVFYTYREQTSRRIWDPSGFSKNSSDFRWNVLTYYLLPWSQNYLGLMDHLDLFQQKPTRVANDSTLSFKSCLWPFLPGCHVTVGKV